MMIVMKIPSACCPRNSANSRRRRTTRITLLIGTVARSQMILTLTSILVLAVVSRNMSKQIVPTMRTKRKQKSRKVRGEAKPRRHT